MILPTHPRYESLMLRAKMVEAYKNGILSDSGLIAHGRGEAFDYLIGEKTTLNTCKAIRAAAAALIIAVYPVISVNGNTAALASDEIVMLAQNLDAKLEINLFYRTPERIKNIKKILEKAGAFDVLGLEEESVDIEGLKGPRSKSSKIGVFQSDVVLVPLEDGDRTEALISNGKYVITIDLNPLSRTSQKASITIVDNLVRAIPHLIREVDKLKNTSKTELKNIVNDFDNQLNLQDSLDLIAQNLQLKRKEIMDKLINLKVIGVTGMPGSGKGVASGVARSLGFKLIRMGDVIREEAANKNTEIGETAVKLRQEYGEFIVAERCVEKIKNTLNNNDLYMIEGIRSPFEVEIFKEHFPNFKVITVHSTPHTRFNRLKKRMRLDDSPEKSEFLKRDKRELNFGIGDVIATSDYIVVNEGAIKKFKNIIRSILQNEIHDES